MRIFWIVWCFVSVCLVSWGLRGILTACLILGACAATDCQQVGGLQSCTEGPDTPVLQITGSASGVGLQESEFTVGEARVLLESVNDAYPSVEDWCFILETHGFETDGAGLLLINETQYEVFENGSIFEKLP